MTQSPVSTFEKIFSTTDFSQWEAGIKQNLGTHHSHLCSPPEAFHSSCHAATVGPLHILYLEGKGELELDRTQVGRGLLWLPLKGITEERINGKVVQAKRGQAILIRPFDHLHGVTSLEMSGVSILLPENFFLDANRSGLDSCRKQGRPPDGLLRAEPSHGHAVIAVAMQLSRSVARRDPASGILAAQLLDQLEQTVMTAQLSSTYTRQSLGARRRWQLVQDTIRWMQAHLTEAFRIRDVATALGTPTRTIQHAFAEELGRSPLAQAKLMRLHALRRSLQDPEQRNIRIATQMAACGLPASGETAESYRGLFGEQPRQTKRV